MDNEDKLLSYVYLTAQNEGVKGDAPGGDLQARIEKTSAEQEIEAAEVIYIEAAEKQISNYISRVTGLQGDEKASQITTELSNIEIDPSKSNEERLAAIEKAIKTIEGNTSQTIDGATRTDFIGMSSLRKIGEAKQPFEELKQQNEKLITKKESEIAVSVKAEPIFPPSENIVDENGELLVDKSNEPIGNHENIIGELNDFQVKVYHIPSEKMDKLQPYKTVDEYTERVKTKPDIKAEREKIHQEYENGFLRYNLALMDYAIQNADQNPTISLNVTTGEKDRGSQSIKEEQKSEPVAYAMENLASYYEPEGNGLMELAQQNYQKNSENIKIQHERLKLLNSLSQHEGDVYISTDMEQMQLVNAFLQEEEIGLPISSEDKGKIEQEINARIENLEKLKQQDLEVFLYSMAKESFERDGRDLPQSMQLNEEQITRYREEGQIRDVEELNIERDNTQIPQKMAGSNIALNQNNGQVKEQQQAEKEAIISGAQQDQANSSLSSASAGKMPPASEPSITAKEATQTQQGGAGTIIQQDPATTVVTPNSGVANQPPKPFGNEQEPKQAEKEGLTRSQQIWNKMEAAKENVADNFDLQIAVNERAIEILGKRPTERKSYEEYLKDLQEEYGVNIRQESNQIVRDIYEKAETEINQKIESEEISLKDANGNNINVSDSDLRFRGSS